MDASIVLALVVGLIIATVVIYKTYEASLPHDLLVEKLEESEEPEEPKEYDFEEDVVEDSVEVTASDGGILSVLVSDEYIVYTVGAVLCLSCLCLLVSVILAFGSGSTGVAPKKPEIRKDIVFNF